jgi:hypothetical protein
MERRLLSKCRRDFYRRRGQLVEPMFGRSRKSDAVTGSCGGAIFRLPE